ncbi:hypothetical protein BpHYR1_002104 [Brachionus plicatilis]|uniref:Uncharacterized protein n=1 Tax=Brachionus plicatilis TaxID=10195 RepID=A0A3M7T910_BRAPC|nr:hypothetical protein BpHYR1_002104 [Brachionus plicatilis]
MNGKSVGILKKIWHMVDIFGASNATFGNEIFFVGNFLTMFGYERLVQSDTFGLICHFALACFLGPVKFVP